MLAKRVIPCLDVHAGRVTRGQQFGRAEEDGLRNVGDPVELAVRYNEQGADELVFFDITASSEGRKSIIDVIERTADRCFMPLTVGGGVRSTEDMRLLLRAGADKISLNSAALARPRLIAEGAEAFGRQCMVVSIDAKRTGPDEWSVFTRGGRERTGWEARKWAAAAVEAGAGEIVLNSIDADGMQTGYDLKITRAISEAVPVPVVASGGAWELAHFTSVLDEGRADAVLAASVFHYGRFTIGDVKSYLASRGVPVRM
jgi:cyclase